MKNNDSFRNNKPRIQVAFKITLKISIAFFYLNVLMSTSAQSDGELGYSIAQKMFNNTDTIASLTYTINKEERIKGELVKQVSYTKMVKQPFKIYLRQLSPKDGMEVLYNELENKKALINPNGFPWINLRLNPNEGLMRNDQHHTIFHSGFEHSVSILKFLFEKYEPDILDMLTYNGIVEHDGRECYSIQFDNPNYKYIDYTIQGAETIEDIAWKNKLSEYMILQLNESIDDYSDVKEGQTIKIPNDYSPRMLLFVDKEKMIPVKLEVYDDLGLYEKYEYTDVTIDPEIPDEEFLANYKEYGF